MSSCPCCRLWVQLSGSEMFCCNHKSETSSAAVVSQATVTTPPGLTTSAERLPHSTACPARLAQQCLFKINTPRTLCFVQKKEKTLILFAFCLTVPLIVYLQFSLPQHESHMIVVKKKKKQDSAFQLQASKKKTKQKKEINVTKCTEPAAKPSLLSPSFKKTPYQASGISLSTAS